MKAILLALFAASALAEVLEPTALCSVGYYRHKDAWGVPRCSSCPAGKFSDTTTATQCTTCAPGRYQLKAGQNLCDNNPCLAGEYMSKNGECALCKPGTYSGAKALSCELCPHGFYNDKVGAKIGDCIESACPKGTYQRVNPARCVACAMNQYSDTIGASSCKYCAKGIVTRGNTACHARATKGVFKECTHTTCAVHNKCDAATQSGSGCTKKEKFVVRHKGTSRGVTNWSNGIRHRCKYSKLLDKCECICWNPEDPADLPPVTPAPTAKVVKQCKCPAVYKPVKCADGRSYSNACRARCHVAVGCTEVPVSMQTMLSN